MAVPLIEEDEVIQVERDPWIDNIFRPFLITVMIMCLNISLVNLVRLANPAWRGTYFLIAMFLTTVEAIYSYRVLQRYSTLGKYCLLPGRCDRNIESLRALRAVPWAPGIDYRYP